MSRNKAWIESTLVRVHLELRVEVCVLVLRGVHLNTDEFIPHEIGPPFGWIGPEIAQYPKCI